MSSASASAVGAARNYPFLDRIEELRTELPTRAYGKGLGLGRHLRLVSFLRHPRPDHLAADRLDPRLVRDLALHQDFALGL